MVLVIPGNSLELAAEEGNNGKKAKVENDKAIKTTQPVSIGCAMCRRNVYYVTPASDEDNLSASKEDNLPASDEDDYQPDVKTTYLPVMKTTTCQ